MTKLCKCSTTLLLLGKSYTYSRHALCWTQRPLWFYLECLLVPLFVTSSLEFPVSSRTDVTEFLFTSPLVGLIWFNSFHPHACLLAWHSGAPHYFHMSSYISFTCTLKDHRHLPQAGMFFFSSSRDCRQCALILS